MVEWQILKEKAAVTFSYGREPLDSQWGALLTWSKRKRLRVAVLSELAMLRICNMAKVTGNTKKKYRREECMTQVINSVGALHIMSSKTTGNCKMLRWSWMALKHDITAWAPEERARRSHYRWRRLGELVNYSKHITCQHWSVVHV